MDDVTTADGRTLEVLVTGPDSALALVYHSGTPSAAVPWPALDRVAGAQGVRAVTWSRPGYAGSTEQPERSVADVAADTVTVLDALGLGEFVTLGWSGGGPHALACAALLPERCLAAATLAGAGPYGVAGLDFLAGMAQENRLEFGAALEGHDALDRVLIEMSNGLGSVTPDQVAESLGGLVSEVDRQSLTGELAAYLAAALAASVSTGVAGWRDDDLAFTRRWGFDLDDITVPVAVWQGRQDLMVPPSHGRWLAAHVPGVRARLFEDEGHLSLVNRLDEIVADLTASAARST